MHNGCIKKREALDIILGMIMRTLDMILAEIKQLFNATFSARAHCVNGAKSLDFVVWQNKKKQEYQQFDADVVPSAYNFIKKRLLHRHFLANLLIFFC